MSIDNPPEPTIPTLPDDTQPGKVPPMGPGQSRPDDEDFPLEPDSPGQAPDFPPGQRPFPDNVEPPADHPQSQ
jgi:hypothetical protein